MMRCLAVLLLIVVAQTQPPPRFRTGVDLIEVDVTVLDEQRRPVRGLVAADFSILEDGEPQDVVAFDEIDLPAPDPSGAAWLRDVAPDVSTNEPKDGRIIVLVLDDATMPSNPMVLKTARDIAREVISHLGPQDRGAVLFTRDNASSQDFTSDRGRLTRAVDKLTAGFIRPGAAIADRSAARASTAVTPHELQAGASREDALWYQYSIQTVRRAAEYLRDAPQRRKTLLYISVGVPVEFAPGGTEGAVTAPGADVQRDLAYEAQRAFVEAVQSNVVIYGVDPAGLQVNDTRLTRRFLQTVSENTGGRAIVNTNAPAAAMPAVMQESGSYYLLGFQPKNPKADGRFRRLQVRVNRPGVTVRARRGYYGPRQNRNEPTNATSPLDAAIGGLLPRGDLPMRVAAIPFANPGKREATLLVATGFERAPATERAEYSVDLLVALYDNDGAPKASAKQTVSATTPPGVEDPRYDVLSKVDVKPGRYLLRVAAHEPALGRSGSVYTDVDVPDFAKADLALSGVILTAAPGVAVEPREAFQHLTPIGPTTRREFTRHHALSGFVRVYQGGRKSAAPVALTTRVLDAANREVFGRTETLAPAAFSPQRAADYRFELPLTDLSRGPYVLILDARAGRPSARRDVRFVVQ